MMSTTTIVLQCGIDNCTAWVKAEYDPGEPMTRDHPGYPDGWVPYMHGTETSHEHLDTLGMDMGGDLESRCNQIAIESWDTYYVTDWNYEWLPIDL